MKLSKSDSIITAFAEYARGPGWSNTLIWVIVQDGNGKLRREAIQPRDQTEAMYLLFGVSSAAHAAMVRAVERSSD